MLMAVCLLFPLNKIISSYHTIAFPCCARVLWRISSIKIYFKMYTFTIRERLNIFSSIWKSVTLILQVNM